MGDMTPLSASDARHLLRRSGFGARQDRVATFTSMTRGATADLLLSLNPSKFKPLGKYIENRHNSWVRHMVNLHDPLKEVEEKPPCSSGENKVRINADSTPRQQVLNVTKNRKRS